MAHSDERPSPLLTRTAKIWKFLGLIGVVIICGGQMPHPPPPNLQPSYSCTVVLDRDSSGNNAPTNPSWASFQFQGLIQGQAFLVNEGIYEQPDVFCHFESGNAGLRNFWSFSSFGVTVQGNNQLQGDSSPNCGTGPGPFTSAVGTLSNNGQTAHFIDNSHSSWNGTTAECTAQ